MLKDVLKDAAAHQYTFAASLEELEETTEGGRDWILWGIVDHGEIMLPLNTRGFQLGLLRASLKMTNECLFFLILMSHI